MSGKEKKRSEVLFVQNSNQSLSELADILEEMAEKMRNQGSLTLSHDTKEQFIQLPPRVDVEFKVKQKGNKSKLEIEIEWRDDAEQSFQIK